MLLKVGHLSIEVADRDALMKEYEDEFLKDLFAATGGSAIPEVGKDIVQRDNYIDDDDDGGGAAEEIRADETKDGDGGEEVPNSPSIDMPPTIKKLWKAIAAETHPDRTGGDPEMTELYKRASDAWMRGALEELIDIAVELRISIPDPDPEILQLLKERSDAMSKRLESTEKSMLWLWANSPPQVRAKIMERYIQTSMQKS